MKRSGCVDQRQKSIVRIRYALMAVALIAAAPSLAAAQIVELNTDRPGSDYRNFALTAPNYEICLQTCEKDDRCKAWTYVQPGLQGPSARCWLKGIIPDKRASTCCVSGYKKDVAAKPGMSEQPVSAGISRPSPQNNANDSDDLGLGRLERLEKLK